jgi:hypothetical protein
MDRFAGLDVSVKETSVCIVDEVGKIVREVKVASEPTLIYFALVLATVPVGAVSSISWLILRLGYRAYRKRRDILAIHPGAGAILSPTSKFGECQRARGVCQACCACRRSRRVRAVRLSFLSRPRRFEYATTGSCLSNEATVLLTARCRGCGWRHR